MNLMKFRKWYYAFSMLFVIPSIVGLLLWGLKPSIDFTGGSKLELRGTTSQEVALEFAKGNNLQGAVVQKIGENGLSIRFAEISEEKHREIVKSIPNYFNPEVSEVGFETVGPTISSEITRNAFLSVLFASLIIIFYIGYSFRKVPRPATSWQFGITAIIALFHDTLIVVGAFAFLGKFMNIEVDPLFITGLLTVIGFSVHDTIVIFDRIRENLIRKGASDFEGIVSLSLIEMLPRTINTSFLVWSILLILFLAGGLTIKYFVLTLVIGILAGTYSSLFVASPLLITWQEVKKKRAK